jgi:hypothetical protein
MSKRAMHALSRGLLGLSLLGLGLADTPGLRVGQVQAQDPPPGEEVPVDAPPPPDSQAKQGDPTLIVFQLGDAGKEAYQDRVDDPTQTVDNAQYAHTRFQRDRETGSSRLGPNVIDTKAWVAKDVEAAKAIFKVQAAIKNYPERAPKERVQGVNDRFKPPQNLAEETCAVSAYYQDDDDKVWRHYRYCFRKGNNVGVLYLFGREDLFDDWNPGLDEWFARTYAGRL